jgi:hypothetical protein
MFHAKSALIQAYQHSGCLKGGMKSEWLVWISVAGVYVRLAVTWLLKISLPFWRWLSLRK